MSRKVIVLTEYLLVRLPPKQTITTEKRKYLVSGIAASASGIRFDEL